ncbi:VOC family protein [Hoeflea sp. YIM 152468]|uniref:VOC family protein n=1 Tax=Hoeflea sp. YIM 152468 TaxID=3031759 RepID=UPI0023DAF14E|nr:VOC family protein [Hoeflea sp. YIM 152468]MDF1609050.1 VOC family protein [Hoeflea sp. YIM 152468]
MIGYITVGADDMAVAETFYSAFLPRLGYRLDVSPAGLSWSIPAATGQRVVPPDFYVKPPFNGEAASTGNGSMVAFQVRTQALVRELHAAALAAGGGNEGAPGFRADYSACFYVGYLRDPQGNKVALFCNHPDQPTRPG